MNKKKKIEERKLGEPLKDVMNEMFCQYYAGAGKTFGNEVWSYVLANDVKIPITEFSKLDKKEKKQYKVAATQAWKLLKKGEIKQRCNEILDSHIKHEIVDRETVRVILQNRELGPKVAAIREYNDVNQRIIEKHEYTILDEKSDEQLDGLGEGVVEELARRKAERIVGEYKKRKGKKKGNS